MALKVSSAVAWNEDEFALTIEGKGGTAREEFLDRLAYKVVAPTEGHPGILVAADECLDVRPCADKRRVHFEVARQLGHPCRNEGHGRPQIPLPTVIVVLAWWQRWKVGSRCHSLQDSLCSFSLEVPSVDTSDLLERIAIRRRLLGYGHDCKVR